MAEQPAEQFIEALRKLESEGDVDTIVGLFDESCEVGNTTLTDTFHGVDGARKFWTNYRETLGDVRSEFRNKIIGDNSAALEWTTTGSSGGQDISYEGVSVLEMNNGKVSRFFAYFNPGKLGDQIGG